MSKSKLEKLGDFMIKGTAVILLIGIVGWFFSGNDDDEVAIEEVAYFEFQNGGYWIYSFTAADSVAPSEQMKEVVKSHWQQHSKTTYHFFMSNSKNAAKYKTQRFDYASFVKTVKQDSADYSFYNMVGTDDIVPDAAFLLVN
mgnify:CR=1 FL=1